MTDEELLEKAADVPTIYCDGFGAFRQINGALRCIGYVIGGGAQINLVISLAGAEAANAEARRILEEKPATRGIDIIERMRIAH